MFAAKKQQYWVYFQSEPPSLDLGKESAVLLEKTMINTHQKCSIADCMQLFCAQNKWKHLQNKQTRKNAYRKAMIYSKTFKGESIDKWTDMYQ